MRYLAILLLLAACESADYDSDLETLGAYTNPICLVFCGTTTVVTDSKGSQGTVSPNYSESSTLGQ